MNNEEKLGKENIGKLILTMSVPAILAQIINLLYNIIDRIYIGHIKGIGSMALTGVGVTLPIIIIITAFSAFVGNGGAPLASIALGKGDRKEAERILGNGVTILFALSIILSIIIWIYKKPILYFIGASDFTYKYASEYLSICLIGTFFVEITVGLNPFIIAQGNSKTAMLSILIGAIINIILDPIFIFVFNMGVQGAAIATVFSQACSASWIIKSLVSKESTLRIKRDKLILSKKTVLKIAALGVSPFVMSSTESLISIVMNSGLKSYGGDNYVGALTVMQSVMQIISVPVTGFTQGVTPIISYNFGAGNTKRVKKAFVISLSVMFSFTALIALSGMIFPSFYAKMFTNDKTLIDIIVINLPIFICGMLVFGIQRACQTTFLALGQAKVSLFIALLRKVFLLVPLAIILPKYFGVVGIYWSEPISDITAALTCGVIFLFVFKKLLNQEKKA